MSELTAERLRELLDYDRLTGAFTRKIRTAQRHQVGSRADFAITTGPMRGYRRVGVDSRRYLAHRLAWLHVHGSWPSEHIDHINGNPSDNRLLNLRDVPNETNRENMRQPRSDNTSGYLGVSPHQGRWRSRLRVEGKMLSLGCFDTPEEAHQAYLLAKRVNHKGCTI